MNKNIHVRDFDGKLHGVLTRRARARGLSLSEYLRIELSRLAERPQLEDVLARLSRRERPVISRTALDEALQQAREDREGGHEERHGFAEPEGKIAP